MLIGLKEKTRDVKNMANEYTEHPLYIDETKITKNKISQHWYSCESSHLQR